MTLNIHSNLHFNESLFKSKLEILCFDETENYTGENT